MDIEKRFQDELDKFISAPFMFIGSGFSRRYLGLEDWGGMLNRFCDNKIDSFDYYFSMSNSNLPRTASLMSRDFCEFWWKSDEYNESRRSYQEQGKMISESSPLKYEISKYLKHRIQVDKFNLRSELEDFKNVVIDGIITTNWDTLIESIFPDYDVYVGQSDLVNSVVQQIGEIYKIHGSVTDFNSLVLTDEDYRDFNSRNAYLAAKLLAIFMEHPIVFLGYSISDGNIREILKSISFCISEEGLKRLENSLYFVEPIFDNSGDIYEKSYVSIDNHNIPVTIIKTCDYSKVYRPLQTYSRKLSIKQMKQIKSQIYEIVKDNDPKGRIGLIDINDDTDFKQVDFVLGVGVKTLHEKGLIGLDYDDYIEDIVLDNRNFDPKEIVELSLPQVLKHQYRIPYHKYLKTGGYIDEKGNIDENLHQRIHRNYYRVKEELKGYGVKKLKKEKPNIEYEYNLKDPNILRYKITRDGKDSINIILLEKILRENIDAYLNDECNEFIASNFRTFARIYDWLKYS